MPRKIITLISFKIENKFEEWAKIFDSKVEDLSHSEFDITSLLRVFSKDYPEKVIYKNQPIEANIQKFFQANIE